MDQQANRVAQSNAGAIIYSGCLIGSGGVTPFLKVTAIAPKDHRRALNTLRYIHANPKAAGVRKGFYDPYSNYGHYGRLECDGLSKWHPSFLQPAPTLKGCSRRFERFCQKYRHFAKAATKCHWGSKMLKRLVEKDRSKSKWVPPGQLNYL